MVSNRKHVGDYMIKSLLLGILLFSTQSLAAFQGSKVEGKAIGVKSNNDTELLQRDTAFGSGFLEMRGRAITLGPIVPNNGIQGFLADVNGYTFGQGSTTYTITINAGGSPGPADFIWSDDRGNSGNATIISGWIELSYGTLVQWSDLGASTTTGDEWVFTAESNVVPLLNADYKNAFLQLGDYNNVLNGDKITIDGIGSVISLQAATKLFDGNSYFNNQFINGNLTVGGIVNTTDNDSFHGLLSNPTPTEKTILTQGLVGFSGQVVQTVGSGLNDLSFSASGTTSTTPQTFTVNVIAVDAVIVTLSGVTTDPVVNDIIVDTVSGATGTIYLVQGNDVYVKDITVATFAATNSVTYGVVGNENSATADAVSAPFDLYNWGNGLGASGTNVAMSSTPVELANGITLAFSGSTGHTNGDEFTCLVSSVTMRTFVANHYLGGAVAIGDTNNSASGVRWAALPLDGQLYAEGLILFNGDIVLSNGALAGEMTYDSSAYNGPIDQTFTYTIQFSNPSEVIWNDGSGSIGPVPVSDGVPLFLSNSVSVTFPSASTVAVGSTFEFVTGRPNYKPFSFDTSSGDVFLGDPNVGNLTAIAIEDAQKRIQFKAETFIFDGNINASQIWSESSPAKVFDLDSGEVFDNAGNVFLDINSHFLRDISGNVRINLSESNAMRVTNSGGTETLLSTNNGIALPNYETTMYGAYMNRYRLTSQRQTSNLTFQWTSSIGSQNIDATSGDVTVTLATCGAGTVDAVAEIYRTDSSANDGFIATTSGQAIDGFSLPLTLGPNDSYRLKCITPDGSTYRIKVLGFYDAP